MTKLYYSQGLKFPSIFHAHAVGSMASFCGKVPTDETRLLIPADGMVLCRVCAARMDTLIKKGQLEPFPIRVTTEGFTEMTRIPTEARRRSHA